MQGREARPEFEGWRERRLARPRYAKRAVRRLPSLLPRALAQSAGYEGFLSSATSAWIIDAYCSSFVVNTFL